MQLSDPGSVFNVRCSALTAVQPRTSNPEPRTSNKGFTLVELMVSIGILLVLGVIIIGFLRGALSISRTGAARGEAYATSQTVMRTIANDLAQVLPGPAHPDGSLDDSAFLVMHDPFGRQMLAFTRAWGEEQRSAAGYDAGRGSAEQGYTRDFSGRNVDAAMRASHGNIEVVYLMEPSANGVRLYRAERSPPDPYNGLISAVAKWCTGDAGQSELVAQAAMRDATVGGEPLWDQFHLVADNVVAFGVECWDDWGATQTWFAGPNGPVHDWSLSQRAQQRKFLLPKALRVTLIVAMDDPVRAETVLGGQLDRGDTSVFVDDTANFNDPSSGAGFLRVNGEVIAYAGRSGRTFSSCVRGVLGTQAGSHLAGSTVLSGEVFRRVIQLPVAR
jgi:prepilin-type N-terminal cleavage/methylation domain-containing protein